MGLERIVFGARVARVKFGIGIDSFEYKRRGLRNFCSICVIQLLFCKQVFAYSTYISPYLLESLTSFKENRDGILFLHCLILGHLFVKRATS